MGSAMSPSVAPLPPPPASVPERTLSGLTLVDTGAAPVHGSAKCAVLGGDPHALPSPPKSPACDADRVQAELPADEVPAPRDMAHLQALLKEELGAEGIDSSSVNVARIVKLMERYVSNARDWAKYALFDPCRYTRNLVDDGNGKFNLIVLCWGPGQVTPIHDHADSHCCMKMLDGSLTETRYEFPSESGRPDGFVPGVSEVQGDDIAKLKVIGQGSLHRDEVVYINDSLGLHRVSNLTPDPAVSLHLYSPPIKVCKTYCERTGTARASGTCVFYSVNGERIVAGGCGGTAPSPHSDADSGVGKPAEAVAGGDKCRGKQGCII